jgi:hypothetical protein
MCTNGCSSSNSSQGLFSVSPPKQYPLRLDLKKELTSIIKDLMRQGLLIECSNPYNSPILGIRKRANKQRLVQDLHPVVSNPYMLPAQITPGSTYYSVLDLNDAFFCILFHHENPLPLRTPQKRLDRSPGLSSPRDSEIAPSLTVGSNTRLCRVAISTSYSAMIYR